MWLLVAPRAAKVLMVMRASGSSRLILASAPRNGAVRGSQPETTARKSGRRLTRRVRYGPSTFLDGTGIRAHQKAAGAEKRGPTARRAMSVKRWAVRVAGKGPKRA